MALFVSRWREDRSFETAFRRTFGVTTEQFEDDWRKHVRSRYGWMYVLSRSAIFWAALALVLLAMVSMRTGRTREAMARLRAGEPPDQPAYWEETDEHDAAGGPEGRGPGV